MDKCELLLFLLLTQWTVSSMLGNAVLKDILGMPFSQRYLPVNWHIHIDNYGKNAAVFFNDAIAALNDKLVAAGGIVQVGVLKDVSILYFSHYWFKCIDFKTYVVQQHQGVLWPEPVDNFTELSTGTCTKRYHLDIPIESMLLVALPIHGVTSSKLYTSNSP